MEFKTFTVADLETHLRSENFWAAATLPITKQRAWSFCRNPRAEKDDPVLLVAYQGPSVVGYLGLLPDRVFAREANYRLGWLTGWWVDPHAAGTGIGAILLYKALSLYPDRVGVSGGSRQARKILKASQRFVALTPLKGLEVRIRIDATGTLLRRFPALRIGRAGLKVVDLVLDEVMSLKRLSWERRNRASQRLTYEYIGSIDSETECFIETHQEHDIFRKDKAFLDWIMNCPWIISAPQKDCTASRFYFSSISARFAYLGVKVFEPGKGMVGFLLLSVRNDRVTLLLAYFAESDAPAVTAALVHHALAMDVSTLRLYDRHLIEHIVRVGCPRWSTRPMSRGFFLSRGIAQMTSAECRLQAGDGDFAFY